MAVPNPFQHLRHGVLLCKKNFSTFVETFNFLVDFARNISGDGDNGGQGKINVDKTIPDRPVIRFNPNNGVAEFEDVHSIVGDTESSVPVSGNVLMSGAGCGITVLTSVAHEEEGQHVPPSVTIDVKDRDEEEDDWGAHSITYTDSRGDSRTAHILASEDIDIQGGSGSLDDVNVTTKSFVVGVPFTSKKTSAAGVVSFQLTIGSDPEDEDPSEEGGDNYCNGLSDDGICGILKGGNEISANGFESENQFGSGGFGAGGNGISNTPCVNNNELT